MLLRIKILVVALLTLLLSAGCSLDYDESMRHLDHEKTLARIREFQTRSGFDFSKVVVAKLNIDEQPVKVTSLRPERLAYFKDKSGESLTLALFNQEKDSLILFTHDAAQKKGYEVQLPLSDFASKKKILFPVVDKDSGQVANMTVALLSVSSR